MNVQDFDEKSKGMLAKSNETVEGCHLNDSTYFIQMESQKDCLKSNDHSVEVNESDSCDLQPVPFESHEVDINFGDKQCLDLLDGFGSNVDCASQLIEIQTESLEDKSVVGLDSKLESEIRDTISDESRLRKSGDNAGEKQLLPEREEIQDASELFENGQFEVESGPCRTEDSVKESVCGPILKDIDDSEKPSESETEHVLEELSEEATSKILLKPDNAITVVCENGDFKVSHGLVNEETGIQIVGEHSVNENGNSFNDSALDIQKSYQHVDYSENPFDLHPSSTISTAQIPDIRVPKPEADKDMSIKLLPESDENDGAIPEVCENGPFDVDHRLGAEEPGSGNVKDNEDHSSDISSVLEENQQVLEDQFIEDVRPENEDLNGDTAIIVTDHAAQTENSAVRDTENSSPGKTDRFESKTALSVKVDDISCSNGDSSFEVINDTEPVLGADLDFKNEIVIANAESNDVLSIVSNPEAEVKQEDAIAVESVENGHYIAKDMNLEIKSCDTTVTAIDKAAEIEESTGVDTNLSTPGKAASLEKKIVTNGHSPNKNIHETDPVLGITDPDREMSAIVVSSFVKPKTEHGEKLGQSIENAPEIDVSERRKVDREASFSSNEKIDGQLLEDLRPESEDTDVLGVDSVENGHDIAAFNGADVDPKNKNVIVNVKSNDIPTVASHVGIGEFENWEEQFPSKDVNTIEKPIFQEGHETEKSVVTSAENTSMEVRNGPGMGSESSVRPFPFLVKMTKLDDTKLREQVRQAQLLVDEKTQLRDAFRLEIMKYRNNCREHGHRYQAAMDEAISTKKIVKSRRAEINSLQTVLNKVKNAETIKTIDARVLSVEHMIEHETLSLPEEKQFIREIKQLKQLRDQLSSSIDNQDEIQQAINDRDQIEARLMGLRKELDGLKDTVLKAEAVGRAVDKMYMVESKKMKEAQDQYKAADIVRQEAYMHMQKLKTDMYEKNQRFRMYRRDLAAAYDHAAKRETEALHSLCFNQVETAMDVWKNDAEFRKEYVTSNSRSTLRRLGTFDGRSLSPDEKPLFTSYGGFDRPENASYEPLPPVEILQQEEVLEEIQIVALLNEDSSNKMIEKEEEAPLKNTEEAPLKRIQLGNGGSEGSRVVVVTNEVKEEVERCPIKEEVEHLPSKEERLSSNDECLPSKEERLSSKDERLSSRDERLPSRDERLPSRDERLPSREERFPSREERLPNKEEVEHLPNKEEVERLPSKEVERLRRKEEVERLPSKEEVKRLPSKEEVERLPSKEEVEAAKKAEELRKEELRLEEKAKALEAIERKKKIAEKAQSRAELRAQKEAEQREKEREKRLRKKERKKAPDGDNSAGDNTVAMKPEHVVEPTTKEPESKNKSGSKAVQYMKQQSKNKSIPPAALRNRGRKKLQQWFLGIVTCLVVILVFIVINVGFFTNLSVNNKKPNFA